MKKLIIATLAATTAAAVYAHAETGDRKGGNSEFRAEIRALVEGDGMKVEDLAGLMKTRMAERFAALDADKNGTVTRDEFVAASAERAKAQFEKMNPDENSVVTRDRSQGHHRSGKRADMTEEQRNEKIAERFAKLDTNSDGMLSSDEFKEGMGARGERGGRDHGRRGGWHDGRHGGEHAGMPEEMKEMRREMRALMRDGMTLDKFQELAQKNAGARFDKIDAAGKGEVTLDEFSTRIDERAEKMFARMDRNDDGVVTKDDRPQRGGPRGK
jgi:Ca2+-binding EF-hand superfamily protein